MRVIPVFLRVVACPLLSAIVIFSAATGASAQQSGAQQKPTVIKPDASDKNAAEQSKLVFRKAWAGHKAPELPESKLVVRSETNTAILPKLLKMRFGTRATSVTTAAPLSNL
jgi:hypothetical protein